MNPQANITHQVFSNFLSEGAFIRDASGVFYLLVPELAKNHKVEEPYPKLINPQFFYINQKYPKKLNLFKLNKNQLQELCSYFLTNSTESSMDTLWIPNWIEPDINDFSSDFSKIKKMIEDGSIQKAVPVVFGRSSGYPKPKDRVALINKLIELPLNLFVYGYWDENEGIIGATPELLFIRNGQDLQTMALAGTKAKNGNNGASVSKSLLEDHKERHEHLLVVKDITSQLEKIGHVGLQTTSVMELPSLCHLRTDIECFLNEDISNQKIIESLHPTPALGVYPRSFGVEWMKELKTQIGRNRFGAPFGIELSKDQAIVLVAIRNLQWNIKETILGSGCGIVKQSDLNKEWSELQSKRDSVKKYFE